MWPGSLTSSHPRERSQPRCVCSVGGEGKRPGGMASSSLFSDTQATGIWWLRISCMAWKDFIWTSHMSSNFLNEGESLSSLEKKKKNSTICSARPLFSRGTDWQDPSHAGSPLDTSSTFQFTQCPPLTKDSYHLHLALMHPPVFGST